MTEPQGERSNARISNSPMFAPAIIVSIAIIGGYWTLSNNYLTIREHVEFEDQVHKDIARLDAEVLAASIDRAQYVTHAEAQLATEATVEREVELQRQLEVVNSDLKALQTQILHPVIPSLLGESDRKQ